MDKIIDLNFIPTDLDGNNLMNETLAKKVGKMLCETNSFEYVLEKYLLGKELYETGVATFVGADTPEGEAMLAYFKQFCKEYTGFSTEIKGQILLKFN